MILVILKFYFVGGEEILGIIFNFNVYFFFILYFYFYFLFFLKKSGWGGDFIFIICKFKKKVF